MLSASRDVQSMVMVRISLVLIDEHGTAAVARQLGNVTFVRQHLPKLRSSTHAGRGHALAGRTLECVMTPKFTRCFSIPAQRVRVRSYARAGRGATEY